MATAPMVENAATSKDPRSLAEIRTAQREWSRVALKQRLRIIRKVRAKIASSSCDMARAVPQELIGSLHRSLADTLVAEVMPLAEACRYLEREAEYVLAPRRESASARPLWLSGVEVEVTQQPIGAVLIIGPANYPLLLPGVQIVQALVAGNAVLCKPAPGCSQPVRTLRRMLVDCGLDPLLLQVLNESPDAALDAIAMGVDKVFLTGSENTGKAVALACAQELAPSVMELSGCDAVFVLEGADLTRITEAVAFGLRLNGAATCMAPRRLFVTRGISNKLIPMLKAALERLNPVPVPPRMRETLSSIIVDAQHHGAEIVCDGLRCRNTGEVLPTLIAGGTPSMRAMRETIFAPLLSIMEAADDDEAMRLYQQCPLTLTAAIFGNVPRAERLAAQLNAGVVILNDLIVPTADPRVPFGGNGRSGFGRTRGREGLLEMTATKTIVRQRSNSLLAYRTATDAHQAFFTACIQALHGIGLRTRLNGVEAAVRAARKLDR